MYTEPLLSTWRLQLQMDNERKAQEAVAPSAERQQAPMDAVQESSIGAMMSVESTDQPTQDESDDEEEGMTAIPTKEDGQASTAISSDDPENRSQTTTTETDKAKLHLVTSKPPKQLATPQLVTLKQRERAVLIQAGKEIGICRGDQLPMAKLDSNYTRDFPDIEEALDIRPVTTPSSGNCMAVALVQAVADHDPSSS
ncbi:unnamed protein product [Peronospora destructor]|uniref:Uncharacterized protein n=1 Tax=Peronospora destructor TaxID=86335 RepID=A0AAV0VB89_9STRA|nr:unnamed protein product [Peronospora destructor]